MLKHESPPAGSEPLSGDALQAVCVHLMRTLAQERPLIWVIEDLHFAAQESRDFVLALARAVESHRVLLIATARPGLPDEERAHLGRLDNFKRIALNRLGAREIVQLLANAFKSDALAEKLAGKIGLKSDGVPFFVFEMIRGLKEGNFITVQADGSYVQMQMITEIEVPSAVKDLIEGRMRGLSKDERAILDIGAVQGLEFDPGLVARVLEEKRVRVLRELADLERRSGLVRATATGFRFDQNQILEVVYGDLAPPLREEYHTLLAEAFAEQEEIGEETTGEDAVFLASHHMRGSRPGSGLPFLDPALECLETSYRNEEAIALADRALSAKGLLAGTKRAEVLLKKAARHDLRGERDSERAALDEALALADESGEASLRSKARRALGWHLQELSRYEEARGVLRQAQELAREAGDKKLEATATWNLGVVCLNLGRLEEAQEHFGRHQEIAGEIGDRRGEAAATGNLGNVFAALGRFEK
ncbi:MAG: tetratricopeptide repeat protein, partial [Planctomycetota bacterium]